MDLNGRNETAVFDKLSTSLKEKNATYQPVRYKYLIVTLEPRYKSM